MGCELGRECKTELRRGGEHEHVYAGRGQDGERWCVGFSMAFVLVGGYSTVRVMYEGFADRACVRLCGVFHGRLFRGIGVVYDVFIQYEIHIHCP